MIAVIVASGGSGSIIGCCAIGGQAVGAAAALCKKYDCTPRALAPLHIRELQQQILKGDGFLPNVYNEDAHDLARSAVFTASSHKIGGEPEQVNRGYSRKMGEDWNAWISNGISKDGERLNMQLADAAELEELRLTFWSDFSYPIRVTMAPLRQKQQRIGVPAELIRDYTVSLIRDGSRGRRG